MRVAIVNGFRIAVVVALASLSAACASMGGLPSVLDEGKSPRSTTIGAIDTAVTVLDKLTIAAEADLLPAPFLDDVGEHAATVTGVATAYLDATEACVVIDGALQTDTSVGRPCTRSAIGRAFGDLRSVVRLAIDKASAAGAVDTARGLLVASLLLDGQMRPASGDVWTGYEKVDDRPRAEFAGARLALKAAFDRFTAASAGSLARQTAAAKAAAGGASS